MRAGLECGLLELVLAADLHWPAGALGEQEVEVCQTRQDSASIIYLFV